MATSSMAVNGQGRSGRMLGSIAIALVGAVILAVAVPAVQRVRATAVCSRLGGDLRVGTESVEPLLSARTVYRCYGPGGRVLGRR